MNEIKVISAEKIKVLAPATFQKNSLDSLSEKYVSFNTETIIKDMKKLDWQVVDAKQNNVKDLSLKSFQYHMLTFENANIDFQKEKSNARPQVIITNSHNGKNTMRMWFGMIRFACLNNMVLADTMFNSFKIRHRGYTMGQLEEGLYSYIGNIPEMIDKMQMFQNLKMSQNDRKNFAKESLAIRYPDVEKATIEPIQLLGSRREEDQGMDLWTTYNIVQENLLKGGLTAPMRTIKGNIMNYTTKEIKRPENQLKLNVALWTLVTKYAGIK